MVKLNFALMFITLLNWADTTHNQDTWLHCYYTSLKCVVLSCTCWYNILCYS